MIAMPGGVPRVRIAATLVLLLAAASQAFLAVTDHGIFWPDEIYQSLEPAHRVVFGYGIDAWEFSNGARSWLFPGVFIALWKILAALGVQQALSYVIAAKLLMAAISVLGVAGAMLLATRLSGPVGGTLAGVLLATFPLELVLGCRCLAEVACGTGVLFAALLALDSSPRRLVLAGVLAGLVFFLRYQTGLVLVGLGAMVFERHSWVAGRWFLLGAGGALLAGALLDAMTWGSPVHSLLTYLAYNLRESSRHGVAPAGFYPVVAWESTGPALAALAAGWFGIARRERALLAIATFFVIVHSVIPHKEYRFLMPVVPLLLALAGAGLGLLLQRHAQRPWIATATGFVLGAAMVAHAQGLDLERLGLYDGEVAGALSPWHLNEGANRLLMDIGGRPDACGVGIIAIWLGRVGGFTYLHRDIPLLGDAQRFARGANYVLMPPADSPGLLTPVTLPPPEYVPLASSEGWTLFRRPGGCTRDATGDDRRLD